MPNFQKLNQRISKHDIKDAVEPNNKKGHIILKPKVEVRKDWEDSFQKMHEQGDDKALINDVFEDESFEEWK